MQRLLARLVMLRFGKVKPDVNSWPFPLSKSSEQKVATSLQFLLYLLYARELIVAASLSAKVELLI
jgi:hypothetical protein